MTYLAGGLGMLATWLQCSSFPWLPFLFPSLPSTSLSQDSFDFTPRLIVTTTTCSTTYCRRCYYDYVPYLGT